MKLGDESLQVYEKQLFQTNSYIYFDFIFSERITVTVLLPKKFEIVWAPHFLSRNINKNWCYLYFPCSITFLHVEYMHLTMSSLRLLSNKQIGILCFCNKFLFYAESKRKALQKYPSFFSAYMLWHVLFQKT